MQYFISITISGCYACKATKRSGTLRNRYSVLFFEWYKITALLMNNEIYFQEGDILYKSNQ